jgi:hypothetical protein
MLHWRDLAAEASGAMSIPQFVFPYSRQTRLQPDFPTVSCCDNIYISTHRRPAVWIFAGVPGKDLPMSTKTIEVDMHPGFDELQH